MYCSHTVLCFSAQGGCDVTYGENKLPSGMSYNNAIGREFSVKESATHMGIRCL